MDDKELRDRLNNIEAMLIELTGSKVEIPETDEEMNKIIEGIRNGRFKITYRQEQREY